MTVPEPPQFKPRRIDESFAFSKCLIHERSTIQPRGFQTRPAVFLLADAPTEPPAPLARARTSQFAHPGFHLIPAIANFCQFPNGIASGELETTGRRELAEVFFDDVRVDRERVVGDIDGGWAVAMHLMQYERGMYGYAVLNKVLTELSRLREDMVTAGSTAAQRQRFARVYVDIAAAQARTATTVRRLAAGEAVGADSSIDKLLFGRAERDVNDLVLEITRDHLIAGVGAGGAVLNTARAEWWYSRAATVMGGTAEVQRGIIADHLLGLPKERGK